jgi:ABC-type transport system involved in multi-copper enzyme maturation permease subunit
MGQPNLLHYRPWRGEFREPLLSVWPVARVGLRMMFRYWPFWVIYGLGMLVFLFFFFGQYFLAWADTQVSTADVQLGGFGHYDPHDLFRTLRHQLKLAGNGETYRNFFWYQSYIILVVLALGGSMLIGNDIRHGSLAFYLSKPIRRWHYLLGKCLAAAVFINMLTTLPALLLFVEFGFLDGWDYVRESAHLCFGILGYGLVLTVTYSLLVVTISSWMKTTVPIIMTWTALFLFPKLIAGMLVDQLHFSARLRLMDLWDDAYLIGNWLLDIPIDRVRPWPQPEYYEAALVLLLVWGVCLVALVRRLRAVEIVK